MIIMILNRSLARDLTIEAAQSASAVRSAGGRAVIKDPPFVQVKKLLDSRHDREVLEGLKKVVSVGISESQYYGAGLITSSDDV